MTNQLIKKLKLKQSIKIAAFSYKDHSLLKRFEEKNFLNTHKLNIINSNSIIDLQNEFSSKKPSFLKGKFDLLIIRHCNRCMHII